MTFKTDYQIYWKKCIAFFVTILMIVGLIYAASSESAPSLTLNVEELLIAKGKSAKITAALSGTKTKLLWESDDASVATVTNGNVTGKQNGTTLIKCSTVLEDGKELSSSCKITVYTPLQSIKTAQALTIDIGQTTEPLEITFSPTDVSYKSLTWTSDNEDVAIVNEEGRIFGVSEGVCKITATSMEPISGNNKAKTASCKVTVYRPVSSITIDSQETMVLKGKNIQLSATISPDNATNKKVTWESSDPSIAAVASGKVTGKTSGNVTIKCSITNQTGEMVSSDLKLTVLSPVTSISPQSNQNIVNVGTISEPLALKIQPDDATCKDVTWSSKDETIATVDPDGKVTGIKAGKTSIIATSVDPYAIGTPKTCTISITVNQGAEKLVITGGSTIAKGKTAKLSWKISPEDTTNKKIEWTSSNEKVARISNGTVSAVGVGKCTITGKMSDGSGVSATHEITVIQAVKQIKQNSRGKVAVTEGKTKYLSVTVLPSDATNKKLTWSSDSSYIATVDSTGQVTAKNAGSCIITARATDGSGVTTKIPVYVEPQIPLDATTFTRSGYFGAYYEFAITFKNLTKTRTIKYISFDLKYSYSGSTQTYRGFYTDSDTLGPGSSRRIGWWDQIGYRLSYCSNFRVYLRSVKYSDGSWDYFGSDEALIGWF